MPLTRLGVFYVLRVIIMKQLVNNQQTMTSRELHKIIYDATGKFKEIGNFHAKCEKVLKNQWSFILQDAEKLPNGKLNNLNLNEVQCNMVMASIDINHLQLVSEVFVKVKNTVADNPTISKLSPRDLARKNLENDIAIGDLLGAPKHLTLIESVKSIERELHIDYTPLLNKSKYMEDIKEEFLEPTELGRIHGMSAIAMNKILAGLGLQVKIAGGWQSTDKGEIISTKHAWKKRGKSGYNYKWNVNIIENLLK